jgi:pimeloyl-ACP methyl ester carboxylesterase
LDAALVAAESAAAGIMDNEVLTGQVRRAARRHGGGRSLRLQTERGDIPCLYHAGKPGVGAVIWVGGFDGGFDGPADRIYATLAADLLEDGVGSLRLSYRVLGSPGNVEEAVYDVLGGVSFLSGEGAGRIGLVGHSFGGAVAISAAALSPDVSAVATMSTQTAGTALAPRVAPRPLLLIHGEQDRRLPPDCSRYVYRLAGEPKELIILPGARHSLRQRREELRRLLRRWLVENLAPQPGDGAQA